MRKVNLETITDTQSWYQTSWQLGKNLMRGDFENHAKAQ